MTLRFFFIQLWVGKPKNMPITYDDLVDAETRVLEKEEALAVRQDQINRVVPLWRLAPRDYYRPDEDGIAAPMCGKCF